MNKQALVRDRWLGADGRSSHKGASAQVPKLVLPLIKITPAGLAALKWLPRVTSALEYRVAMEAQTSMCIRPRGRA